MLAQWCSVLTRLNTEQLVEGGALVRTVLLKASVVLRIGINCCKDGKGHAEGRKEGRHMEKTEIREKSRRRNKGNGTK